MLKRLRLVAIMSILLLSFSTTSSAHEMYYSGSAPNWTPINLKWGITNFGNAYLKTNGDYLSSDFNNHYDSATNAWHNIASKIQVNRTTFANSNVDIITPTLTVWKEKVGFFGVNAHYGITELTSTDDKKIVDANSAINSTKLIKYGYIYLNPNIQIFGSENDKLYTMVHELGHVLGLGHPDYLYYPVTDQSVMKQGAYSGYASPRPHDINDVSYKY